MTMKESQEHERLKKEMCKKYTGLSKKELAAKMYGAMLKLQKRILISIRILNRMLLKLLIDKIVGT